MQGKAPRLMPTPAFEVIDVVENQKEAQRLMYSACNSEGL